MPFRYRNNFYRWLLPVFVLLLALAMNHVAAEEWRPTTGPEGGEVSAIIFDPAAPDTMYLKTSEGVKKSVDAGVTWSAANQGLGRLPLHFLVMDPMNSSVLYAGASDRSYRSTDAGATWTPFTEVAAKSLVIQPGAPGIMFATTDSQSYRTSDGGVSWQPMAGLPASPGGYLLSLAPSDPNVLYAASLYSRIYKSSDSGLSWTALGQLTSEHSIDLRYITVDPKTAMTVYAGGVAFGPGLPSFHYKSVTGGASWSLIRGGLPTANGMVTGQIVFDPVSATTLYSGSEEGIYRSLDDGGTWTLVSTELPLQRLVKSAVQTIAFSPANPRLIFLGLNATGGPSLYRSVDGGVSWQYLPTGLRGSTISTLWMGGSGRSTLFAGISGGGVFRSDDRGGVWSLKAAGLPKGAAVNALAGPISQSNVVYAATTEGVFKTVDSGVGWMPTSSGLSPGTVVAIATHPYSPDVVYAATLSGVFKSINGGATWLASSSGMPGTAGGAEPPQFDVGSLAVDPSNPAVVYAAGSGGEYASVFKSIDGGETWRASAVGMASPPTDGNPSSFPSIKHLVVAKSAPQTIYALGSQELFRSPDGGSSWIRVTTPGSFTTLHAIAVGPVAHGTIYLARTDHADAVTNQVCGSVIRSEDAGQSWGSPGEGTPCQPASALLVDEYAHETVYAGFEFAGVYKRVASSTVTVSGGEVYVLADTRPVQLDEGGTVNISPQYPADVAGSVISLPASGSASLQMYGSERFRLRVSGPTAQLQLLDGSTPAMRVLSGIVLIDSASVGALPLLDVGMPSGSSGLVASGQVVSSGTTGAVVEASALGDGFTLLTVRDGTILLPCGALCPAAGEPVRPGQMLVFSAEQALMGPEGQLRRLQMLLPTVDLQGLGAVASTLDVPRLANAQPARALGAQLTDSLPGLLADLLGGVSTLQAYGDTGAVGLQSGSVLVGALPIGMPTFVPGVSDGAVMEPNGNLRTVFRNISMEFAPMVAQMGALSAALSGIDPQSRILVRASGAWQVQLATSTLSMRPSWFSLPGPAPINPTFATDETGQLIFIDSQGRRSALYPALADADRLLAALRTLDPNAQLAVQPDGEAWALFHGQQYWLVPRADLTSVPPSRVGEQIWEEGSGSTRVLWMQLDDGLAQSLSIRTYP